jgi:superfamily II DNA or RNA helicase
VIFDECHHATIPNCLFFSNNKVWKILGLTATLPTISKHEIADSEKRKLIDKLCPSIFRIPIEHAIALRLVTDFLVKVLKFELDSVTSKYPQGDQMLTEREYYDFLTRNLQLSMFAKHAKYAKFPMMQKRTAFLYNLETKKKIAKDVMKYFIKPEKRTLIFCGSIDMCDELCWPYVFHSEVSSDFLELFVEKKSHYCGAVKALNEGKNIPDVDQTLVVQLTSKDRDIIQRIGRSIRWRDGVTPVVVILVAMGTADEKWYQKAFKKFDKSRIKEYIIKPE